MKRPWGAWVLLGGLLGCAEDGPQIPEGPVKPRHGSGDSIPVGPVSGTLAKNEFVAQSARYYVDRRPRYERVDVYLSADPVKGCDAPTSGGSFPLVWLRRKGAGPIETGKLEGQRGKPATWAVHYEFKRGKHWHGSGDAGYILKLEQPSDDGRLRGALSVCFADGWESCVAGSFEATRCPMELEQPVRGVVLEEPRPSPRRKAEEPPEKEPKK